MSALFGGAHAQRLSLLRGLHGRLLLGLAFMAMTVVIQLCYPQALSHFIDHIDSAAGGDRGRFALLMLAVLCVQAVATTLRYYLFESTGYLIVARMRRLAFSAILAQPIAYFDKHRVGELCNRLSADVEVLHDSLTMGLAIALRSALVVLGGVSMLLLLSPALSLVLLIFIPMSLALAHWAGRDLHGRAGAVQDAQAECGKVAHEHIANIRLVQAFNQRRRVEARYGRALDSALAVAMSSTRLFALFRGASSLLVYLALLATLWLGAGMIGEGRLSIGELTAFVVYAGMVAESASAISDCWGDWMRTLGATERVFELVESAPPAPAGGGTAPALSGRIRFEGVELRYPERPEQAALEALDLDIAAGEKLAVVGPSGAGKSSIASLLLGFYPPSSGVLRFDGQDSRELDRAWLRSNLAIVEQEPSLFSGSIHENIAFGVWEREVGHDEVVAVARLANAHDFIQGFPQGYDTLVGERGLQLSGGQKQRIAIARALLRNPRILILDEATSALDSANEMLVQNALEQLMSGRTTLIITHRYATVAQADRILVLEQGRLVQQGRPGELLRMGSGPYYRLMESQLAAHRQAMAAPELG